MTTKLFILFVLTWVSGACFGAALIRAWIETVKK